MLQSFLDNLKGLLCLEALEKIKAAGYTAVFYFENRDLTGINRNNRSKVIIVFSEDDGRVIMAVPAIR